MSNQPRIGGRPSPIAVLVLVLTVLIRTGEPFKIYDLLESERFQNSNSDVVYVSLEDCTADRCHEPGSSRVTRALCVLQCFLKTSSPDPVGLGTDLRGRQVDPLQACIEAKCLDSHNYMRCAFDQCLIGRRSANPDDQQRDPEEQSSEREASWRPAARSVLDIRSKRPIELCSGCFPNSSSWPKCRSSCGK